MASTSFSLSNQSIGRNFPSAAHSPLHRAPRHQLRFVASHATAHPRHRNARQTASFYEVLGVQSGATCQEIKSAYRRLARVLHPDVASNGRGDDTSAAADEFIRVHAAYATLSDPEKRVAYDGSLFRLRRQAANPSCGGDSELTRWGRTWETDQCW